MIKQKLEYKPLLFTTTIRNPERLKSFLSVLFEYNSKILNNEIIEKIAKILIKQGLYKPTKVSNKIKNKWKNGELLNDSEIEKVFKDNPQKHKEAGFPKGWSSRFDTWFKLAKELGFVWYSLNDNIKFSKSGEMLIKSENELLIFRNAFVKYQRNNPFRAVLNKNTPLILLIKTIKELNKKSKNHGISKRELPLLLCWQDNNSNKLANKILDLRKLYGYSPSDEIILEIVKEFLNDTVRDNKSILNDYPDEFIRKMRLTGLFSLRGNGRFIDINSKEEKSINYILKQYDKNINFSSEREFFDYISNIDIKLMSYEEVKEQTTKKDLKKWADYYSWNIIKKELLNLTIKKESDDLILKFISQPLRLEFLISIALLKQLENTVVNPNFISDDEGLPVSFATGGNSDIECFEQNNTILIEVTLLTGTQQHIRESFSVHRHLETFTNNKIKSFSIFVAPEIFIDTKRYFNFIKKDGLDIFPFKISDFVNALEQFKSLCIIVNRYNTKP